MGIRARGLSFQRLLGAVGWLLIGLTSMTFAADRYWVAPGSSGTWNNTANWSATSGGSGGASVPGSADQAIFDGRRSVPCVMDVTVYISSLTISTSTTGGFTSYVDSSSRTLTITQNFTMNNGTFFGKTSSMTVQNNWSVNPVGNYVAGTSSVTFLTTSTGRTISTGGYPFYKLIFSGAGGGWTTKNYSVTVSSFVTQNAGTLTVAENSTMTVAGSVLISAGATLSVQSDLGVNGGFFTNAGTITSVSTATVSLAGAGTLGGTGTTILPNLLLSGSAQTTTLGGKIIVLGDLTNGSSHTLDASASNFNITISNDWTNSGTFTARSSSVTFNGSNTGQFIKPGGSNFYIVRIDGSGSWQTSTNQVQASSFVLVNQGTLTVAQGSTMTVTGGLTVFSAGSLQINTDVSVRGGFLYNSGSINSLSTATVSLLGTGTLGGPGSSNLPNLTLSGNAQTTTLSGAIVVLGSLSNTGTHVLNTNATSNFSITVGESWSNVGTFTVNSASVTFSGSSTGQTIAPGASSFFRLRINGTGGGWTTATNNLSVSSNVFIDAGSLTIANVSATITGFVDIGSGGALNINNNLTINGSSLFNDGTITSLSTPTVTLAGTGTLGGTGSTYLPNLTLNTNATTTTLGGGVTLLGNLSNTGTHILTTSGSNYPLTVGGSWSNAGTFTANTSSVTFNGSSNPLTINPGASAFYALNFDGSGRWVPITNAVSVSSDLVVNAGTLNVANVAATVTGDVVVNAAGILDIDSNLTINGGDLINDGSITAGSTPTVTLSGAGTLGGTGSTQLPRLTMSGAAQTTTLGGPISVISSMTISASHTLDANSSGNYTITISSYWANIGTFNAQNGTVVVNSTAGFSGSTTFNDLTATTAGITLTFLVNSTQTVNGTLTLTGASGNLIRLRSSSTNNAWFLRSLGTANVSFVDVRDSDARYGNAITPTSSTNSGNNRNWVFGSLRTWWGSANVNWSDVLNWDYGVPGVNDTVLIVSTATRMPTLDVNVTISTLTVVAGSSLTINGFDLVLSSFTNGGNIALFGLEAITSAPNNVSGSTVTYYGSNTNSVVYSTWGYSNLFINGSGGVFSMNGSNSLQASLTVTAGTLDTNGFDLTIGSIVVINGGILSVNDSTITVSGNWLLTSGNFVAGTGGVSFDGPLLGRTITTLGRPFNNVTFSGTGYWTLQDSMTLNGDLSITAAGTLDTKSGSNFGITVGREWLNTAGTFVSNLSTVTWTGSDAGLRIQSRGMPFFRMYFNGPGSWQTSTTPVTISSHVLINAGALTVTSGSTMTVVGNITVANGASLSIDGDTSLRGSLLNSGTVDGDTVAVLTTSGTFTMGGTGSTFLPNWTLTGNAQTTTLGGGVTLLGNLSNTGTHILTTSGSNYPLTVGGSWSNTGTFTANSSSVTFNGSSSNQSIVVGASSFYNLRVNGTGSWYTLTNAITVSSNVVVDNGLLTVSGSALTVTGDVDVNTQGVFNIENNVTINGGDFLNDGTVTALSTPTVTLSGAGTLGGTGSTQLPRLTMSGAAQATTLGGSIDVLGALTNSASHTLDVKSGSNYALTVSSDWLNSGTFACQLGSVTFTSSAANTLIRSGGSDFYALRFNGSGSWVTSTSQITVRNNIFVDDGTLSVTGTTVTVLGDMNIATGGTLNISNNMGISGGDLVNDGTISSLSTATVNLAGTGILGGAGSTILPRLTMTGASQTTLGGDITVVSSMTIGASHTLDVNSSGNYTITISSYWANLGTFNAQSGTVVVNSTAGFTGSTTFYHFTAATPGITLTFLQLSTQTIAGTLSLTGLSTNKIKLRSSAANPFCFRVLVSTMASFVDVQNSNATGNTIYAGKASTNSGGNTKWVFDYLPDDITTLVATPQANGDILISWSAPLDSDDNPLGSGSQYAIEWATYTVVWSTSNAGDTGYTFTKHIYISTSSVSAGDPQVYVSTGLSGNITYYFRIWTKDPLGNWSSGLSNGATVQVTEVISISVTPTSYNFGSLVVSTSVVATSSIVVTNNGNVTETYSLQVSTTGATVWNIGTSTPTTRDVFVMHGAFHTVKPSTTTYDTSDVITPTTQASTLSKYSINGTQTGASVSPGNVNGLWLMMNTPPQTSTVNPQTMTVTISASTP